MASVETNRQSIGKGKKKKLRPRVPSYLKATHSSSERHRVTKAWSSSTNPLEPSAIGRSSPIMTEDHTITFSQAPHNLWYQVLKQPEYAPCAASVALPSSRVPGASSRPTLYAHTTANDYCYNGQPLVDKGQISRPRNFMAKSRLNYAEMLRRDSGGPNL